MVKTRGSMRSRRHFYAANRKKSQCRGVATAKCRHKPGCKMAMGPKRSFCRKAKVTKRVKGGRRRSRSMRRR